MINHTDDMHSRTMYIYETHRGFMRTTYIREKHNMRSTHIGDVDTPDRQIVDQHALDTHT